MKKHEKKLSTAELEDLARSAILGRDYGRANEIASYILEWRPGDYQIANEIMESAYCHEMDC